MKFASSFQNVISKFITRVPSQSTGVKSTKQNHRPRPCLPFRKWLPKPQRVNLEHTFPHEGLLLSLKRPRQYLVQHWYFRLKKKKKFVVVVVVLNLPYKVPNYSPGPVGSSETTRLCSVLSQNVILEPCHSLIQYVIRHEEKLTELVANWDSWWPTL